ncbi:MAG: nucleotidyltransferase family protein [Bacteroidales bacterium]|nr:nucleotidyltransferase family protein [Bacteroidales bacterium]
MKCLILAAGYATRLYPLTENFPKPLLEVGGKPILDWLVEDLDTDGAVDGYVVVTNHKYAPVFEQWAAGRNIRIIDDGTSSNDGRLGAVKDMLLGINVAGIDDDLLVMAGDNLLSFSLCRFLGYARSKGTSCIMRYHEPDLAKLHKTGVIELGPDEKVISMEEKPAEPKSNWCCPPFYYLVKEDVPKVGEAVASGCGVDAPGSFIAWLCGQTAVHAWEMPGRRYDIWDLES